MFLVSVSPNVLAQVHKMNNDSFSEKLLLALQISPTVWQILHFKLVSLLAFQMGTDFFYSDPFHLYLKNGKILLFSFEVINKVKKLCPFPFLHISVILQIIHITVLCFVILHTGK